MGTNVRYPEYNCVYPQSAAFQWEHQHANASSRPRTVSLHRGEQRRLGEGEADA